MSMVRNMVRPMVRSMVRGMTEGLSGYSPLFWFNNMGQMNTPTGSTTKDNIRTSITTVFDHEGIVRECLAGEIAIDGGRRVETLTSTLTTHNVTVVSGRIYQVSCEGDNASTVVLTGAATGTLTNDGVDRQGFDTAKTASTTTLTLTVSGTLTHIQVEDVTGQASTVPGEKLDISTDYGFNVNGVKGFSIDLGNSISSGVVTEAAGAIISPVPQVLMQPNRTNAITYSKDLTNAAWTETGTSVAALDETGMDGVANSGCTLTDDNGAGYEFVYRTPTVANDSNTHTVRAFISNDSDVSRFVAVHVQVTGGTAQSGYGWLNTSTGAVTTSGVVGTFTVEANSVGDRWELILSLANNSTGNTALRIQLIPAAGTVIGTLSTAATGSIIVGNVEFHENKTIDEIRGTSPIFTSGSAVAIDNDLIEIADFDTWFGTTEGILFFAYTPDGNWANLGPEDTFTSPSGLNSHLLYRNNMNQGFNAHSGGLTTTLYNGHAPGTEVIGVTIWSAVLNKLVVGYYKVSEATWGWDPTPTDFSSFSPSSIIEIFETIAGRSAIRGLLIYDGLLPGDDSTLTAVQDWAEANAVSELLKVQR